MMIGNAVTLLNDQGYVFKVHPPELHASVETIRGTANTEAIAIYFDTPCGRVFVNISMQYNPIQHSERAAVLR